MNKYRERILSMGKETGARLVMPESHDMRIQKASRKLKSMGFQVLNQVDYKEKIEFYKKTLVKKSASIGANATIICGVTIGRYALIGSGAVVTKDIPDFSLVVGNPGRVVGLVDKKGNRVK